MSQVSPYASIAKRQFESALVHLLRTEYGFMQGGRRILQLLTEDVMQLIDEYYPDSQRADNGTLVWRCTADEGRKAEPGKRTEEYKSVTVLLPLVTAEEVSQRTAEQPRPAGAAQRQSASKQRDKQRAVRLVKAAASQGGLLTLAELSVILNCSYALARQYVRQWEEETGELLPLKGFQMDQGSRPTHKGAIIRLFEQGMQPPDIARETNHSLKSVERYLKDYERVKLLLKRGLGPAEISAMIDRGQRVVLEYETIARQYHSNLFSVES